MVRVLITGGSGSIAQVLADELLNLNFDVLLATRQSNGEFRAPAIQVGDVDGNTSWGDALHQVNVVVHLAAQTKTSGNTIKESWDNFMSVNRDGTECLARKAVEAGVQRFIYLSSILAFGDHTEGDVPYSENDLPMKDDGYGVSKRKAEDVLLEVAEGTAMEVVILRPPPIYGPNMSNNIPTLFKAAYLGWPLPLKSIKNHLSFIYVGNLVSAISASISHPNARNKKYFVCDQENVSISEFVQKISASMRKKDRLFPFPVALLRLIGILAGQKFIVGRLVNSLNVDGSAICKELNWKPPLSMNDGLEVTSKWYLNTFGK
ncbi:MAG: NAD-dependent epimerase/dehydratase family protein [Rhodospirillales bacterium]|jgi:nucleoside-diphosphate-sugar epimerase